MVDRPKTTANTLYLEREGLHAYALDEIACAIYLYCPGDKIVLLQGYLETYEGLGVVRTIDKINSTICIITTRSMLDNCINFLTNIKPQIPWSGCRADEINSNEILEN